MPSVLQQGAALLRAPATELGFVLRSILRWSRGRPGGFAQPGQVSGQPFDWAAPAHREALCQRVAVLAQQFDLAALLQGEPAATCRNLARLEQLAALAGGLELPCGPDGMVRAADFGCGDFHYAPALQQWLSRHGAAGPAGRRVVLRGLELDGYGIYRDGHSRADHGCAWAAAASVGGSQVRFEVADAARCRLPEQDCVSLFFPFLTSYACLKWGAPLSRLRPRRLLERAVHTLRPGGWLVVVNQTRSEHLRLTRLLAGLPVVRIARRPFATDLVEHRGATAGQVGSVWLRQEDVPSGKLSV